MSQHFNELYKTRYKQDKDSDIGPSVKWNPMFTEIGELLDPLTLLTGFDDVKFMKLCHQTETKYESCAMEDVKKLSMKGIK
jgi:hypothetical protein